MLSMVEKCKESEPIIQRVIESIDGDESLLFEALSLHDELQQVLSKYQELDLRDQVVDDSCIAPDANTSNEEELKTLGGGKSEVANDGRNIEKE